MEAQPASLVTCLFEEIKTLDDPRADNARHFLTDILVIAILAVNRRTEWKGLTSVIAVESIRRLIGKNEVQVHRRYFISSLASDNAERFATLVRNHWSIENSQHWTLDMAFGEDQSRVRKNHGDENLAVLRRIALGLFRQDKTVKLGARNKRLKADRNRSYLLKVLLTPCQDK